MKKYFLSFALALTTILSYGQDISDVEQRSSGTIITLKSNGSEISRMSLGSGEFVKNVSGNNIIVKRPSGTVITYDKNFREISRRSE